MSSIKAILSDYDGVLIPDEYRGIKALCPDEEKIIRLEESYYAQTEDSGLWNQLKNEFSLEYPISEIVRRYNLEDAAQETQFEEILHIYTDLKKQGISLLLLSNQVASRSAYLRAKPALSLFDRLYLSSELGMRKPEADIFFHVLSNQRLNPNEVIFIDDAEENIDQAKTLGLQTILFKDVTHLRNMLERLLSAH